MKTNYKKILNTIIIVFIAWTVQAQQIIEVRLGDNIELEADAYRGSILWQISLDNENWNDIDQGNISPFMTTVNDLPSYFRAKILEDNCAPHYSEVITTISDNTLLWSDVNTWGSDGKPEEGQQVTIPEDTHIILDETPPILAGLEIQGTLEFDRKDLELTSKWIVVNGGKLQVGTESNPFEQKAVITLNDTDTEAETMNMGTRGIMVMSGALELHGVSPNVIWTKINQHAEAGTTSLELMESVDWKANDEIVIAPTDYYEAGFGVSVTQLVSINSANNNQLTISEGLNAHRWGLLQYPTENGLSLTSDNVVSPPVADTETTTTPLILDERAEVGNMTRNIVIQAPNDNLWNDQGFGVHTMIMPNASAHIEGVEFKRVGQRGRLRRYAFHWHMLSYLGTETLEDATGQYFRNNTINSSQNRGVVIHGTNGVLVQNNIIYDIRGHGVFTEDAVERRNIIDGNLVLHIRNPIWGNQLKEHEIGELGSSAFWISNPDNTITNNTAADSRTFGFWLAFPEQPWGLNQGVLYSDGMIMRPNRMLFGVFDSNTAHSNRNDGIHLDDVEISNDGTTAPIQYWSTTDGRTDFGSESLEALKRFSLSRYKTWKNLDNGAWDRAPLTDIYEVVSADNCGRFFAGSGSNGVIERSLVVGTSLNFMMNGTGRPEIADFQFFASASPVAFATYHSAFSMRNNIVVNFPVDKYDRAGVFASDDYYVRPVDKGQVRNSNNKIIASHPGVKLQAANDYFTLASALWDPYGHWGPPGNYFVYDDPFLTHDKDISIIELGTEVVGGVSVPGPFYGFYEFVLHGEGSGPLQNYRFFDLMGINVRRLDSNFDEVATWQVRTAQSEWTLQHMRDFATTPEGIYELTFPDEIVHPTDFQMTVENMLDTSDKQVMGIQFDGNIDPVVFIQQVDNTSHYIVYDQVNSLDEVINSGGEIWWLDTEKNMIWVKIQGGRYLIPEGANPDDYEFINEGMLLRIRAADS